MTIDHKITTDELLKKKEYIISDNLKISDQGNFFIKIDGVSYLIYHNGNRIPGDSNPIPKDIIKGFSK